MSAFVGTVWVCREEPIAVIADSAEEALEYLQNNREWEATWREYEIVDDVEVACPVSVKEVTDQRDIPSVLLEFPEDLAWGPHLEQRTLLDEIARARKEKK